MAERTVIVVLEVPFLETFSMENVEAFQFSDFLGTENRFEADDTGWGLVSPGRESREESRIMIMYQMN